MFARLLSNFRTTILLGLVMAGVMIYAFGQLAPGGYDLGLIGVYPRGASHFTACIRATHSQIAEFGVSPCPIKYAPATYGVGSPLSQHQCPFACGSILKRIFFTSAIACASSWRGLNWP